MTRLALAVVVATAGVTASITHHHRRPVVASEQRPDPLRVSRGLERQPLPGVKPRQAIWGKARHYPLPIPRQRDLRLVSGLHNWTAVAACESSGNWHANTGNGYFGGLQFLLSTWRSFGGRGRPDQASEAEQIRIAERVLAVQGIRAWPYCGRLL